VRLFFLPSKTQMTLYTEACLDELQTVITPLLADSGFHDPYIVTYKSLQEDVQAALCRNVQYYGLTRGSNDFRTTDSAVLLGAYRPPVEFDQLAQMVFGGTYSAYKIAVAHWLQELYRTRIREGHPINLMVMGEKKAVQL
jgi:hypothetical protein